MLGENNGTSSVDSLIGDIRELYNKCKTSYVGISCDLVDDKLASRSAAEQNEMTKNVARAAKQFDSMFKKRSFYERMIERSQVVHPPPSCSTALRSYSAKSTVYPREKLKSLSGKSLHPRKIRDMCSHGRFPQAIFLISLSTVV